MPPDLIHFINYYGYFAIFLLIFLQEVGVPIPLPNEVLMLFSGYLAFSGKLNFLLLLLTVIMADFTGTMVLYSVFYLMGPYLIEHKPKWLPPSTKTISKLSEKINNGGLLTVFICRVTPFIRGYTSVASGLLHFNAKWFVPIALLTSILVCGTYVTLGKIFGSYWTVMLAKVSAGKFVLLGIVALILLVYLGRKLITQLKQSKLRS
jgi:membrane protein DedA with SNARE-associated domain